MKNTIRGSRLVAASLIAACTAISASVATASVATASTAVRASTSAGAATSAHASATSTVSSPARRGPSQAQLAMLEQRAKLGAHASLTDLGGITGRVTGFDGLAVAGACVTAVGAGHSVTTAAAPDGTFRLAGLTAGSYALEYRDCSAAGRNLTSASGYLTTWSGGAAVQSEAARVKVAAGQVHHVPAVMLRPANPAAAIAAGQASFRRELTANSRSLSAAAAAKSGKVSGKVTGNGKPLSGICVEVTPVRHGPAYGADTAKNGTYTVRGVLPGHYHVTFAGVSCPSHGNWLQQVYKDITTPSAPYKVHATAVTVRAGHKVTGIDADLRLGGEISGTVTSTSGAKLRGICVTGYGALGDRGFFRIESQTAANGTYHLPALFPGKYSIDFRIGCGSHGSNYAPADRFRVFIRLGLTRTVNQKLAPGASITGKVTLSSRSGKPLGGICVYPTYPFVSNVHAATNSKGHYRLIGLPGGAYQLQFSPGCKNNGNYTSATRTAHTTAGKQTSNVNAVLQRGATIQGTITGSGGKPLPGICVEIDTTNNAIGFFGYGVLDTNGSYSLNRLPAGMYQVGFYGGCGNGGSYAPYWYQNQPSEGTASWIKVTAGDVVTIDAPMPPGATITGKVTSGGNALSGVCVSALQSNAELNVFSGMAVNTQDGSYTLANLAPGQYLINFGCGSRRYDERYGEQWFPSAPDPGIADLVSAPAGLTANINATLHPEGTIKGVVTSEAGVPLSGLCVSAVNTKDTRPGSALAAIEGIGGHLGVTGSRGTYQISGLAAGRYQVAFSTCFGSQRRAEQWYRDKTSPEAATDVTVRAGKTTPGIDGRLLLGGRISGRVVNASGKPLRGICVVAASQSAGVVGVGYTGTTGTYTIPGLNSGRYTLEFEPCVSQNLVTVSGHAQVTAPHGTTVNATMKPGGSIAGTVTTGSASGPDLSGTCVEVYSGNSAVPVDTVLTGLHGSYRAIGLAVGTYEVYFGDPQCTAPGLAPQWYKGQLTRATAQTVSVTAVGSITRSIDAALQPAGEITGAVSAAGSAATPLSGACVTAVPLPAGSALPVVAVTRSGGYTLADLVPGRYKVKFSAGCGAVGYVTQWWKQKTSQKTATVIRVGPGQDKSGISATLAKSS